MEAAKHTPTPWNFSKSHEFGDTRFYVAQQEGAPYTPHYSDVATLIAETASGEYAAIQEANAAFIVKAVNSHEQLVAALETARVAIETSEDCEPQMVAALWKVVAALAAAGAA